jgi:hypothetical protein
MSGVAPSKPCPPVLVLMGSALMAIYRIFQTMAFEPEEIEVMSAAYEDALSALRLANRQDPIIELVARKIIQVARSGVRDPTQIREQALKELGITPDN